MQAKQLVREISVYRSVHSLRGSAAGSLLEGEWIGVWQEWRQWGRERDGEGEWRKLRPKHKRSPSQAAEGKKGDGRTRGGKEAAGIGEGREEERQLFFLNRVYTFFPASGIYKLQVVPLRGP